MTDSESTSEARARVLDAAESLFAHKGYKAVTLRDIAAEVGIRHTSLYHHVPDGKEALYVEVTTRHLQRHRIGLTHAMTTAAPDVRSQLFAAADWLLSEPPVDFLRLTFSDMPEIAPEHAARLSAAVFEALILPVATCLEGARSRGEIAPHTSRLIAGGMLGMIEGLHAVPPAAIIGSRQAMAYDLLDVLLRGLQYQHPDPRDEDKHVS